MICVFVLDRYRDTIDTYLQTWARSLDRKVRSIAYESLRPGVLISGSSFIFSDLERLTDAQCRRAAAIAAKIQAAGGRVLNHPSGLLRRYALLRSLHAGGDNPYNVYLEGEISDTIRYPVFIRRDRAHNGPQTPLLNSAGEMNEALSRLKSSQPTVDDWLIVEYLHTASGSDGLFRKYSAMKIGDRLIPRHVLFSTDWVDKTPDVVTPELVSEEQQYLNAFPHLEPVRRIFDLARIDYGRIDYSLLNGKLVTWEINTNPVVLPPPEKCHPLRLAGQSESSKLINERLLELAGLPTVTVNAAECAPVIDRSALRRRRRLLFAVVDLWIRLDRTATGRRMVSALARSLRLAKDLGMRDREIR